MEFEDYYSTLGVQRTATQDEIKRAYRKLARKFHPDVSKEPDAESRFKEVPEAHEALIDLESRAAYDNISQRHARGQTFEPPPGWDSGFEFSGRSGTRPSAQQQRSAADRRVVTKIIGLPRRPGGQVECRASGDRVRFSDPVRRRR